MNALERRQMILELLCERRHEKMINLAFEFGVSRRTICRDIEVLSLSYPIYTESCRGGEYEATSFPIVNACTTPKIAMRVIESNFLVTCPHCEKKSLLIHPMYYFDVERNIALVYSRYWNQAKKMAKDIVPVPIGKNGKPIKIKTYSEWCDYNLAMCEYYGSAERRAKKRKNSLKTLAI